MTNMQKFSFINKSMIDEQRLHDFLKQYGGNHISHLLFLLDKELFWDSTEKVLFAYKAIANKLVVLGDPIGDSTQLDAALKEFHEFAASLGCIPVFYQTSKQTMSAYHDYGYKFMKLGEEAIVDLHQFTLAGKQGAKLRTKVNKFQREQYTFEVLHPPFSDYILHELRMVSDEWLGGQQEKSFSVVSFSEEYVSGMPVAILSNADGQMVAFATLATDYRGTITIDLMRKQTATTYGTMDVLFIHIFQWAKEHGYERCSLGMSPLANVGVNRQAFLRERLLRFAYYRGNSFYNFKGLQEFKAKFATDWEPKYLVYKNSLLLTTISQIVLLVNKPPLHAFRVVKKVKYFLKRAI